MSFASVYFPRQYFGLWFGGDGQPIVTISPADAPFLWIVSIDSRSASLQNDVRETAIAFDDFTESLTDYIDMQLDSDGWFVAIGVDDFSAAISDDMSAVVEADVLEVVYG